MKTKGLLYFIKFKIQIQAHSKQLVQGKAVNIKRYSNRVKRSNANRKNSNRIFLLHLSIGVRTFKWILLVHLTN